MKWNTNFSICFSSTVSLLLNAEEGIGLGFHTLMSTDFPTITSDKISSGKQDKTPRFFQFNRQSDRLP